MFENQNFIWIGTTRERQRETILSWWLDQHTQPKDSRAMKPSWHNNPPNYSPPASPWKLPPILSTGPIWTMCQCASPSHRKWVSSPGFPLLLQLKLYFLSMCAFLLISLPLKASTNCTLRHCDPCLYSDECWGSVTGLHVFVTSLIHSAPFLSRGGIFISVDFYNCVSDWTLNFWICRFFFFLQTKITHIS